MTSKVKIQWREDYNSLWKTLIGPHPHIMPLMAKMHKLHSEDRSIHWAAYVDGVLDMAWMPNTGFRETFDVSVNGVHYDPRTA